MRSAAVPSTGEISLAHIATSFPGVASPSSLRSYLGVHPSVPGTGAIDILSFRGLQAVSPTHTSTTLYDTGSAGTAKATAVLSPTTLAISTAGGGTLTLSLSLPTYVSYPSYQGAVTYSVSSAMPTGCSLDTATGIVAVNPALVNTGSTALAFSRTITATNRWGNSSTLATTLSFAATPSSVGVPSPAFEKTVFSSLTSGTTSSQISNNYGGTLFSTPTSSVLAETLSKVTAITGTGQFNINVISSMFIAKTLYGTFFLNNVRQFSIKWVFTDDTNSMDSFFLKSNSTNFGATYTFSVYNASGDVVFNSDASSRKWCFSDSMNYAALSARAVLSADDGIWGAAIVGNLNGNSGPALSTTGTGWGIQNHNAADGSSAGLFINNSTVTAGVATALIYFGLTGV